MNIKQNHYQRYIYWKTVDGVNYYVRDVFVPIEDDFVEKIGEEYDDLDEFLTQMLKMLENHKQI